MNQYTMIFCVMGYIAVMAGTLLLLDGILTKQKIELTPVITDMMLSCILFWPVFWVMLFVFAGIAYLKERLQ